MTQDRLTSSLATALATLGLSAERIEISPPRDPSHGDASTNVALPLAKAAGRDPREVAQEIADALDLEASSVESVEVAGPGFLNFRYASAWYEDVLRWITSSGEDYGRSDLLAGEKVQVEFVSANPTGPLNVVSARAAAVGNAVANLLAFAGAEVEREFYVNDAGMQVMKLALSVRERMKELAGEEWEIPEGGYHGEYLTEIAREIAEAEPGVRELPEDEQIARLQSLAVGRMVERQREELERYGVVFERWFRESSLGDGSEGKDWVAFARERLEASGETYEKDGAVWLRTTPHGTNDDKVIVKQDGVPTYLLPDVAYHLHKYDRGFDPAIDLWGPDHHAHVAEMHAALEILGFPKERLEVQIVQQVNFIEGGERVKMSKRAGSIVTLGELCEDVGIDVAKFFFLMRKQASHLDFDLDLARQQSEENPVFYVQYAHARVASLIRFAEERGYAMPAADEADLSDVTTGAARPLVLLLSDFPRLLEGATTAREPHRISTYLREVSSRFHSYYHDNRIVTDDETTTRARLVLSLATKTVLGSGLRLLGVSAPERM
ncbi:MAG: arginine--tRNA ligase [Armatimonadetes bacterium]|nr:arginine--tRNA ligase [Armatimonadota bacterium]